MFLLPHSILRLLSGFLILLCLLAIPSTLRADTPSEQLPPALVQAFEKAVSARPASLLPGSSDFTIAYARLGDGYAYLNTQRLPASTGVADTVVAPDVLLAIGEQQGAEWVVHLEGSPDFALALTALPDTVLSPAANAILQNAQRPSLREMQTFQIPGLPWRAGEVWRYTQGLHSNNALDFGTPDRQSGAIYSADAGVLLSASDTCLSIRNDDNITIGYQHMNRVDVQRWRTRLINTQGDVVIPYQTYLGNTTTQSGCGGDSTGHHVHLYFGTTSPVEATMNGWHLQRENVTPVRHTLNKDGRKVYAGFTSDSGVYFDPLCVGCPQPPPNPEEDPPLAGGHFPDVPFSDPNYGYIEALYSLRVVNGFSDGLFRPNDDLTRGPAAKIIILGLGEYVEYNDGQCAFNDVCPGHPFYHYIRRLKELGLTSASASLYNPDDPMTRGGYTKFIVLGYDRAEPSYPTCAPPFPDVPCSDTFYRYVRRLKEIFDAKGIGLGYSDGTFRPNVALTRAGATKFTTVGLSLEAAIPRFYDVLSDNLFYEAIMGIERRGITTGCQASPPLFCINDPLTRGQAAPFIIRGLGDEPQYPTCEPPFPDVPCSDTFYRYIRRMKELGITSGFSDGTYRPANPITRGEIAKFIIRALDESVIYNDGVVVFPDVPTTHPFYHDIRRLKELGITNGYSDGTYRPDNNITRGEAAKFIYRAFVQRALDLPQEENNIANGTAAGATPYSPYMPLLVPGVTADQDWVQLTVSTRGGDALPSYQIVTNYAGLNADIRLEIFANPNSAPLQSVEGEGLSGGVNVVWNPPAAGTYYLRLTNSNPFAQDGTAIYLTAEEREGGTTATERLFLPSVRN